MAAAEGFLTKAVSWMLDAQAAHSSQKVQQVRMPVWRLKYLMSLVRATAGAAATAAAPFRVAGRGTLGRGRACVRPGPGSDSEDAPL